MSDDIVMIDAGTFQHLIAELAETIAQKVKREGCKHLAGPPSFYEDIFISIRQARNTYNFLYWAHSDEIRASAGWTDNYTFACVPLVRTLIDSLYNITLLLEDPSANAMRFKASGFRKLLLYLDAEEKRYGGKAKWDEFIRRGRERMGIHLRSHGLSEAEVRDKKKYPDWLTLGKYLSTGTRSPHRAFLERFTYGAWKEYSAIAHGAAEGLHFIGPFLNRDGHRHEERPRLDEAYPAMMSLHVMRAALVMLCIITEVQTAFGFDGARINERISQCWKALLPSFEAKEVYDERYEQLMKKKRIIT